MGTESDQYPAHLSSSATVAGHGDDGGSSTRRREGAAAGGGGGHAASAELERILADESVPSAARLARAAPVELRLLVALRGAGRGGVHDQLRHVDVDADHLRPARHAGARRRLARQRRHPGLRLRPHGTPC
ncbi:hypothetical protein OsJ_11500 [Oryza sativa Japonica Group]|uniref:Uncharacterized protein n=1 Tax=Oryza sativa subsp. japonica TaxID=39947 RepID=B9F9D6_ORYSJ|nr:hypothetical protein OsJ_11500 [Oryza sativa Japonica Group]